MNPAIQLTDQGFFAFCMILLGVFAAEFTLILKHAERSAEAHTQFLVFQQATSDEFRLLNVRLGEQGRVGIFRALDVLSEPNPWTPAEIDIRNKMHRNPDLAGVSTEEILRIIRRLDEEIDNGLMHGDKLTAALYMLRNLNGELADRRETEAIAESKSPVSPSKPRFSGLRWLIGK